MFYEKLKRLSHERKHGSGKQKPNNHSAEEWQKELSHDDIVRILFDLGSAAECKEDPITSEVPSTAATAAAADTNSHTHIRKKAKRSEEDQERDQLQQLLI